MLARRELMLGALASAILAPEPSAAEATFEIDPKYLPQTVEYRNGHDPGTIVVEPRARFLYLVESDRLARRYGIGVGRAGISWSGRTVVGRKAEWPYWRPTDKMIRRQPQKYARYAAGIRGGPDNPLGARALYLYRDGRDTFYRIHGTNEPWTVGRAVSNGCFRLVNEHVIDLYDRVPVGTPVIVIG
jgi:lipoprotein-anchoring transpeptidase ErfK/SrfK